ncbi:MAG: aminoacyl-tRNA hydrolase [Actinobacteria bacterium]|nr:aminoacyl-tRNA hydrolase [Actinomycetota bacterium]
MTKMIVGLGNPGPEYANTRHNAGFHAIDALAGELRATYWKSQKGALVARVRLGVDELLLVKPQSFMNLSGGPVKKLLKEYGLEVGDLVVIHDELDLSIGDVRVKRDGGFAGHKGLTSINKELATDAFARIRVGVGRPPGQMQAADYVLQPLRGAALDEFEVNCARAGEIALFTLQNGVTAAMDRFNGLNK